MEYQGTSKDDLLVQSELNIADWTTIWGLEGNDQITIGLNAAVGGPGNDTIIGTSKFSTAAYYDSPSGITAYLSSGLVLDGFGFTDTLKNINYIQGTAHSDLVFGSGNSDVYWSRGNGDRFDGAGDIDTARISINDPISNPRFIRSGDEWTVQYSSVPQASATLYLKNVEILEIYRNGEFEKWDLTTPNPYKIPQKISDPAPLVPIASGTEWNAGKWGIFKLKITEDHGVWYYPTANDRNGPGNLSIDAHNAALGDFNGDGYQDIIITWVCFPHILPHVTQPAPTVLYGSSQGLRAASADSIPSTASRHQGYRTWAADLNGDEVDDVVTGAMISPYYSDPSSQSIAWDSAPTLAMLGTRSGSFSDISNRLEGQTLTAGNPSSNFDHATAVGDINGDGIDDIFSGNNLWVSASGGSWMDKTGKLASLVPASLSPMSLGIGDLDADGKNDIAVLYPDFSSERVVLFNRSGSDLSFTRYDLPPGLYGNNTKDNNMVLGDVNGDGRNDIIISETRASPYYVGSAIQILIQGDQGTFTDQTSSRIDNSSRDQTAGEGDVWLVDMNGDGHPDIVHSNGGDGIAIFLNDGTGKFSLYSNMNINFVTSAQIGLIAQIRSLEELPNMRAYPVDDNHDGIMDLVVQAVVNESTDLYADQTVVLYVITSTGNEYGRNAAESLKGTISSNAIYGLGGDDSLMGDAGNDTLNGGDGTDLAIYRGKLDDYRISIASGKGTVADSVKERDGSDSLTGIERLRFSDFEINASSKSVASSVSAETLQRVSELYVAFFNRTPDADGLAYWLTQAKAGMGISAIADAFYSAGIQYTSLTGFSASMSNADFVNVIYRNVLGRKDGADADGLTYWSNELASGNASRGSLVSTMLDSAHSFKGNSTWGWVADLLDNKITVARKLAVDWGLNYLSADASIAKGMEIAKAVTPTDTSAAISLVGIPLDAISL